VATEKVYTDNYLVITPHMDMQVGLSSWCVLISVVIKLKYLSNIP